MESSIIGLSRYLGGESRYKILQRHDDIKKHFCATEGIQLLTITYKDNISDKLRESLL